MNEEELAEVERQRVAHKATYRADRIGEAWERWQDEYPFTIVCPGCKNRELLLSKTAVQTCHECGTTLRYNPETTHFVACSSLAKVA